MAAVVTGEAGIFSGVYIRDATSGGRRTVTAEFHGPYASLLAAKPAYGTSPGSEGTLLYGIAPHLKVVTADCARDADGGGHGTLTVTLEGDDSATPVETPALVISTGEVKQAQNVRPILEHPAISSIVSEMRGWMAETDESIKTSFFYRHNTYDENGVFTGTEKKMLSSLGQTWAAKILRGVETWMDFYPVATLTETYDTAVKVETCGRGHIETPDSALSSVLPSGYEWLKTADTVTKNGDKTYSRIREWTGIRGTWDPDIYATP